jgi:hypothetical protein
MPEATARKRHPVDEQFVEDFSKRILDKAAGTAPEYAVIHGTAPKRIFFNGVLCSSPESQTTEEKRIHEIYKPTSCGLDFICATEARSPLKVQISFNVFGVVYQPFDTIEARNSSGAYLPMLAYVRFPVVFESTLGLADLESGMHEVSEATHGLNGVLDGISAVIAQRPDALRERDASSSKDVVLREWTEAAYTAAIYVGDKVAQTWKCSVYVQVSDTEPGKRIQLYIQNESKDTGATSTLDRNFYGSDIAIAIDPSVLKDIPLERAPLNDYRYRRSVIVQGINCNSLFNPDGSLQTCFTPSFKQRRYLPLESYDLRFERIHADADAVFDEIDVGLEEYMKSWESQLHIGELDIKSDGDLKIARGFFETFLAESKRIREGMALIRKDLVAREAFLHMNGTFKYIAKMRSSRGERGITGWYLFQLCFILSLLPSFVNRNAESAKEAHLLWFPTGGGKTEAVMGVVVFAMFYERLQGRTYGITSWMRFPLRLLTFQQMQRYVDVVIAADEVRAEASQQSEALRSGPFTIGYFGGGRNSPNDLRFIPDNIEVPSSLYNRLKANLQRNPRGMDVLLDDEGRLLFQDLRIVGDCFYCGTNGSVEIFGDRNSLTMRHKCVNCKRLLPIYTTDEDVYTQLPTVLVGTLDKLATIGFKSAFRTLVGKSDGHCELHGYGNFGKCLKTYYSACNHSNWRPRKPADAAYGGISILFQDELHLIHEGLGCFDAHYESLLISLCTETSGKAPLIIAASATIEGAEHQLEHLYEAAELRFPGEGPSLRSTFYAQETPDLQRLYIGMRPSNLAHLDTTMSLATLLFDEVSRLRTDREGMAFFYPGLEPLSRADYDDLIDRHTLTVAYVNSKREGQNIFRSVDEQVRDNLKRAGREEIYGITSLTGDSTMDEVKDALRRMKSKRPSLPEKEKLDFAVATSMISHGVDVDRLDTMIFFSYPRSTAEYIQASSRAGRTFPGIVFVVLKSTTYRDRSFYRNFKEVHEALDKMVESVPIDRFAVHAVERTAPGLALGTLLNRSVERLRKTNEISLDDARELDNIQTLKRLVIGGLHFKDIVKDDLDKFYLVNDTRAADWRSEIARILDNLDINISSAGEKTSIPMELNFSTTRVMTSLRDVDPPLDVYISSRISTERGEGDE